MKRPFGTGTTWDDPPSKELILWVFDQHIVALGSLHSSFCDVIPKERDSFETAMPSGTASAKHVPSWANCLIQKVSPISTLRRVRAYKTQSIRFICRCILIQAKVEECRVVCVCVCVSVFVQSCLETPLEQNKKHAT